MITEQTNAFRDSCNKGEYEDMHTAGLCRDTIQILLGFPGSFQIEAIWKKKKKDWKIVPW